MSEIKVTYLDHSGFAAETATKILVFDYYRDPAHVVDAYTKSRKDAYFFVTHSHGDHFNKHIADFASFTKGYIVNDGVPFTNGAADNVYSLALYETLQLQDLQIRQYGSTDEGGSFYVETDGVRIFHAGDLNWWHWLGDTDENNQAMKELFDKEMERLDGLTFDLAFFPVDARLEGAREWGVASFLSHVHVTKCLVPMHYFGVPWEPSEAFNKNFPTVPVWIPRTGGDTTVLA